MEGHFHLIKRFPNFLIAPFFNYFMFIGRKSFDIFWNKFKKKHFLQ